MGAGDLEPALGEAVAAALGKAGIAEGHVAVAVSDEDEIRRLNSVYRQRDEATDVLSFPVDADSSAAGPRELGDVVLCPPLCDDVVEAAVHGVLHLCGYDHETDDGEMLALQAEVMAALG